MRSYNLLFAAVLVFQSQARVEDIRPDDMEQAINYIFTGDINPPSDNFIFPTIVDRGNCVVSVRDASQTFQRIYYFNNVNENGFGLIRKRFGSYLKLEGDLHVINNGGQMMKYFEISVYGDPERSLHALASLYDRWCKIRPTKF